MSTSVRPRTPSVAPSSLTRAALPKHITWIVSLGTLAVAAAALFLLDRLSVVSVLVVGFLLHTTVITLMSLRVEGSRKAKDRFVTSLVVTAFLVAMLPLASLMWSVLVNGVPRLSADFLTTSMRNITGLHDQQVADGEIGPIGGAYHAILGTLIITAAASAISVPIGLMTSIYLVEYGRGKLARSITFFVDVMTGIPSIVAGLFGAALFTVLVGPGFRAGIVGAVALSVLMIPTVVRSCEEMLKLVPNELREAAYALGVPKWRTIVKIVIPTAISGIASGVTLAIARVSGETAPLIVTAGFTASINDNPFTDWMMTLPAYVYQQAIRPLSGAAPDPSVDRAWAAALVLIVIVMALNLIARLIARLFAPKTGR